jgi:hypothetical protein
MVGRAGRAGRTGWTGSASLLALGTVLLLPGMPDAQPRGEGWSISLGQTINGSLTSGDRMASGTPIDYYSFEGQAGQELRISLASSDFDTVLSIENVSGFRQSNDDGDGTNSVLVVTLPRTGRYAIGASAFQTTARGSYTLNLALAARQGTGRQGGSSRETAISMGMTVSGSLLPGDTAASDGRLSDTYVFSGQRGETVRIGVTSSEFDPRVTLSDGSGWQLQDDDGGEGVSALLGTTLPSTGRFRVTVDGFLTSSRGGYELSLGGQPGQPLVSDRSGPAGAIRPGSPLSGTLARGDETLDDGEFIDRYSFQARRGEPVSVQMSSTQVDSYLIVTGPNGFRQADDDGDAQGNDAIVAFTPTSDGTYTIGATSYAGGETGPYTLQVLTGSQAVRPSASEAVAAITPGRTVSGSLAAGDATLSSGEYRDAYTFNARRGERYEIIMESANFDTYVMVRGQGGLSEDNDDGASGSTNARLAFTIAQDGPVVISATSFAPRLTGNYALTLRQPGTSTSPSPPPPPVVASGNSLSLGRTQTGRLAAGDPTLNSGEWYDDFSLNLTAGQSVTLDLASGSFDTYLMVGGPGDFRQDNDDGTETGTNARIAFTAPAGGTYLVRATSYQAGSGGDYALTARATGASPPPPAGTGIVALNPGQPVTGSLASSDRLGTNGAFVDRYSFRGTRGQRISAELTSSAFDTVLTLIAPSGAREQNDDITSGNTNSRLDTTLTADGVYTVETSSYTAGQTGAYRLALSTGGASGERTATVSGGGASSGAVSLGLDVSGRLAGGDATLGSGEFTDSYTFAGRRGQRVSISMTSSDFDSYLMVTSPSGTQEDNDDGPAGRDAQLDWTLPEDGTYRIAATSYAAGETGAYRLRVAEGQRPTGPGGGQGRVYGVFVGISDYAEAGADLDDTDEDAIKLADSLRRSGALAPESVVLTNSQATRAAVRDAIRRVSAQAGPDDLFVVFYSGHGGQVAQSGGSPEADEKDETLVLYDGEMTDNEMGDLFAGVNAGLSLLALDSCFSGGFARDVVSRPRVMGLFSSEEDLTSQVASKFEAGGYLSYFLRNGLAGQADDDGDSNITAGELSTYLRRRFAEEGEIGAVTGERQRSYQYLVVDRGGVKPDDVMLAMR